MRRWGVCKRAPEVDHRSCFRWERSRCRPAPRGRKPGVCGFPAAAHPGPLVQAFSIAGPGDIQAAQESKADWVLLDSGPGGTGSAFDWALLGEIRRPYFLAGGLTPQNVAQAVASLNPYGVDVSSGIETLGKKDSEKMTAFVHAVRSIER